MNYKDALLSVRTRRLGQLAASDSKFSEALRSYPEFYAAEKARRAAVLSGDGKKIERAEKEKSAVMSKLGLSPVDFDPSPLCPVCGDEGLINGEYCECVRRITANSFKSELPLGSDFAQASLEIFKGETRTVAEKSYTLMKSFSEKFPSTKTKNVVILGNAGTGKTYLASCVANRILSRGYSVVFSSAFRFNDLCLKYHTSFGSDKPDYLNPLLDCDLLVIDDLGSESVFRNVTLEYLFLVVDERMRKNSHTVITTNLSEQDLEKRYGERTASRLFFERNCMKIALEGNDLRKQL